MRPKISVYIAMSLDGYIARKNGGLEWLDHYNTIPGEDYGFHPFFGSVDTVIMGRNTYETCSGFGEWPYPTKRSVILSTTLKTVRKEAELFQGNLVDLLAKLGGEGVKKIWVDGGVTVSHFLKEKLVNDVTVTVIPILLGEGIPLFSPIGEDQQLHFRSAQSYPTGIVQLRYALNNNNL